MAGSLISIAIDPDLVVVGGFVGVVVLTTLTDPTSSAQTRCLAGGFGILCGYLIWQSQSARNVAAKDTSSKVTAIENAITIASPTMIKDGFQHRLDGERYSQRVTAPTADLRIRALRRRPKIVNLIARLEPQTAADRGMVTRIVTILEDFYARIDMLVREADPQAVARNMRLLQDARADALNLIASLEWTIPHDDRTASAIRRSRTRLQKQTLREMQALTERHAKSPHVQAADWRPPYPFDDSSKARGVASDMRASELY